MALSRRSHQSTSSSEESPFEAAEDSSQAQCADIFTGMPQLALERLAHYSDAYALLKVSKHYHDGVTQSSAFQEIREANLLQRLLRLEDDEATVKLRETFLAQSNSAATYQQSFQTKIDKVHALLKAYEGFFTHYLDVYEQFKNSGFEEWPADADFDADVAAIEDAGADISHENNALGILKATVRLLKTYSDMRQGGNLSWVTLDPLAIQGDEDGPGIGLAQKLSGKKVIERYFHGDSMVEEAFRDPYDTVRHLSGLGSLFWLIIPNGGKVRRSLQSLGSGEDECAFGNSLSLIKALTNFTRDLQLTEQPKADEINSAEAPQPNH